MSDSIAGAGAAPARAEEKSVVDSLGRKITLRVLDPADMLDFLEAAGSASSNPGWVRYASIIVSVSAIADVPIPPAIRKADILQTARRLGNEGFAAVSRYLFDDVAEAPAGDTIGELAKNPAAPLAFEMLCISSAKGCRTKPPCV
jgi:hypothetical protein